jgi:5'-nucleotidase
MRILISNDDGIHAPGIHALAKVMARHGDVYVVAPNRQRSASSHGISLYDSLYVEEVDFQIPQVTAVSVSGTPVDCVKWGISQLGKPAPFDFMLSGINEGPNLATDVLYSGTVAAAGEAALQGIPALALSLAGPPFTFDHAAKTVSQMFTLLKDKDFAVDTFLNVNFPPTDLSTAEWKSTVLGARGFTDYFRERVDTAGKTYFRYAGEELAEVGGENTDVVTVRGGHVSLTPLRYRFTNDEMIGTLASWLSTSPSGRS